MSYTPRTNAPSSGDPYWTKTTYGGYNEQILGNPVNRPWGGSVLPNCTGYVHGRWMELANQHYDFDPSILPWGNAATYYGNSSAEKGQDPKEGACMVWGRGAGHVCIVEEIIDNDTVVTSESDYGDEQHGGTVFVSRTRHRQWNWGWYSGYTRPFLGFLYHPNISPPEPTYTLTVVNGHADSYVGHPTNRTSIYADVPSGYRFKKWIVNGAGYIDNVNQPVAVFEFGDGDCTIEATFVKISSIKVVNGKADTYTADAGTITKIYANLPSAGHKFYKWIASTTNGTIANPNIMNTTFTFGNGDNTITALYKKRDSLSLMYYISPIALRRRM